MLLAVTAGPCDARLGSSRQDRYSLSGEGLRPAGVGWCGGAGPGPVPVGLTGVTGRQPGAFGALMDVTYEGYGYIHEP